VDTATEANAGLKLTVGGKIATGVDWAIVTVPEAPLMLSVAVTVQNPTVVPAV
jgi:hypothetical protein